MPAAIWALLILLLLNGIGLSRTLRPLHGHREGHHEAGKWLALHSLPQDQIQDDHCWAHYYANRVFLESASSSQVPSAVPAVYVVIGRANERRAPDTPRTYNEEELVQKGGKIVFQWPAQVPDAKAQVVIYKLSKL
jgi:hypothetical protein